MIVENAHLPLADRLGSVVDRVRQARVSLRDDLTILAVEDRRADMVPQVAMATATA